MIPFGLAVQAKDADAIAATLRADVSFSSPAVFRPYEGREATMTVLRAVLVVFEDFRYTDEFDSTDGHVLRFLARVGERQLEGIDLVRTDSDGLVTELTVMIRPLRALADVAAAMGAQLQR